MEAILRSSRLVLFMKGSPSEPKCKFSRKVVGLLADVGVTSYKHVNILEVWFRGSWGEGMLGRDVGQLGVGVGASRD